MVSYRFGEQPQFELRPHDRALLMNGRPVHLGTRAFDILVELVANAGTVVTRSQLLHRVWANLVVEDNNLNVQVNALRKVLGGLTIATIPGRGYCFTARLQGGQVPALPAKVPAAPERLRSNLPATLTALLGRDAELAELAGLLDTERLVTIVGAGGIGKTLLAQHLLRRRQPTLRHGVCFVPLSTLSDPDDIPGAIAAAMQIRPAGSDALAALAAALSPLEVLVMLDNAEHLLDGFARAVQALHATAPGLRLLVTSQAPLKLTAERVYRLGALSVPPAPLPARQAQGYGAIELFVDRAQAADARFTLTDEAVPAAIALCRALDGLPLAIELAAWRAPVLGVQRLAESMDEPLQLLSAAHRDMPPRQRTLRATLAWGYSLLDADAQCVLRRLAVMVGSADLDLLQRVVSDPPDAGPLDHCAVVEALSTLVERSLVAVVDGARGDPRYRLLEAPRAFARELLLASGEFDALRHRHAHTLALHFEREFEALFRGDAPEARWLQHRLPDLDNGQEALAELLRQGDADTAMALLPGLLQATPREELARQHELILTCRSTAARVPAGRRPLYARLVACQFALGVRPDLALELAQAGVETARSWSTGAPDARWLYRALCLNGQALLLKARTDEGAACLAQALALEQPDWPALMRVVGAVAEVWLADRRHDGAGMYAASLRASRLSREAGRPRWVADWPMVNGAAAAGRSEEAVQFGLSVIAQVEGTRHLGILTDTRNTLMAALIDCGRLDEARAQGRAAWPLVVGLSRPDVWADYQALLAALEHRPAAAARLLGHADRLCAEAGIVRTHNEEVAVRRTHALLRQHLDEAELARLMAEGAQLHGDDIAAVAFGSDVGTARREDG